MTGGGFVDAGMVVVLGRVVVVVVVNVLRCFISSREIIIMLAATYFVFQIWADINFWNQMFLMMFNASAATMCPPHEPIGVPSATPRNFSFHEPLNLRVKETLALISCLVIIIAD